MAKELTEDSGFKVSIKTLVGIGAAMANCYKHVVYATG